MPRYSNLLHNRMHTLMTPRERARRIRPRPPNAIELKVAIASEASSYGEILTGIAGDTNICAFETLEGMENGRAVAFGLREFRRVLLQMIFTALSGGYGDKAYKAAWVARTAPRRRHRRHGWKVKKRKDLGDR